MGTDSSLAQRGTYLARDTGFGTRCMAEKEDRMRSVCSLCILVWAAQWAIPPCAGEESLLDRAKQHDDFSKPSYDRELAVKLYQQFLDETPATDFEKLQVLHRIAQLYSYACKGSDERDDAKAAKYYRAFLDLCGERVTSETTHAMTHLASYEKDPKVRYQERLKTYIWAVSFLADTAALDNRILYPPNATDQQKAPYRRSVVGSLSLIRDVEEEHMLRLAAGFEESVASLRLIYGMFRRLRETPEGRAKAREWLLQNRRLWERSPFAEEMNEQLLDLEKEFRQKK